MIVWCFRVGITGRFRFLICWHSCVCISQGTGNEDSQVPHCKTSAETHPETKSREPAATWVSLGVPPPSQAGRPRTTPLIDPEWVRRPNKPHPNPDSQKQWGNRCCYKPLNWQFRGFKALSCVTQLRNINTRATSKGLRSQPELSSHQPHLSSRKNLKYAPTWIIWNMHQLMNS